MWIFCIYWTCFYGRRAFNAPHLPPENILQRDSLTFKEIHIFGFLYKSQMRGLIPLSWLPSKCESGYHQIWQPGQWPFASLYGTVVTPLPSFLEALIQCRSINREKSPILEMVGVGWVNHGTLPWETRVQVPCVIIC